MAPQTTGQELEFQEMDHPAGWAAASQRIVRFVQPKKALASMEVTGAGKKMPDNPEHPAKAIPSMSVTLSGIVTFVRAMQFLKALLPISHAPWLIVTLWRAVQSWKAA